MKTFEEYLESKQVITLYRGEYAGNKGGKFYHPDKEFARQFTQSGRDQEIKSIVMAAKDIFTPEKLPYGGDPDEIDAAITETKSKGFRAFWVDEGTGGSPSVYLV